MTQTELEKQILQIFKKYFTAWDDSDIPCAKEIASLEMEGMYEREFVNWLLNEDCYQNNIWGISLSSEFKNNETEMCDFICERHGKYPVGIDDIIEYWQTNIKKQKP